MINIRALQYICTGLWCFIKIFAQVCPLHLGFLGTDPTLYTATVANVRSVNYQDTDKELAQLNSLIKEYLSKGIYLYYYISNFAFILLF